MLNPSSLQLIFNRHKTEALFHRYITNNHIEPLLKKRSEKFSVNIIGYSVNGLPIYGIKLGKGSKRVLMWSQMHGNESTTTKACFDLLNYLKGNNELLAQCTLYIIPILNPDGAKAYTRLNANEIDLNRDAQNQTQPESAVLMAVFESFKPDYCFNLHGQRTIFSAGDSNVSATVSFLAPAQDEQCTVTANRKVAMEIIVNMNKMLQNLIPNCVGIYDDAFNINCVGDTFQSKNVPTVLFEAGHAKDDYSREEVRKLIFASLINALETISSNVRLGDNYKTYFEIPENKKRFYDIIIRNVKCYIKSKVETLDIAVQYEEKLMDDRVHFIPKIENFGNLSQFFAHKEINLQNKHEIIIDKVVVKKEMILESIKIDDKLFSLNLS